MNSRITDSSELIDQHTTRTICEAVGEMLREKLRPDSEPLPSSLQYLMDEFCSRDEKLRPN